MMLIIDRQAGQPLGFSIGLVLGGYFAQGIGWRYAYYIAAGLTTSIFLVSIKGLPSSTTQRTLSNISSQLVSRIDWIGCLILSSCLGLFSYILAVIAGNVRDFLRPTALCAFSGAILLMPAFVIHVRRQRRRNATVIIAPDLWSNRLFTTLCITRLVIGGSFNAVQYFLT